MSVRPPISPPATAPTPAPVSVATIGPAAMIGPMPGIARPMRLAASPAAPPTTPPVTAPVAAPLASSPSRTRSPSTSPPPSVVTRSAGAGTYAGSPVMPALVVAPAPLTARMSFIELVAATSVKPVVRVAPVSVIVRRPPSPPSVASPATPVVAVDVPVPLAYLLCRLLATTFTSLSRKPSSIRSRATRFASSKLSNEPTTVFIYQSPALGLRRVRRRAMSPPARAVCVAGADHRATLGRSRAHCQRPGPNTPVGGVLPLQSRLRPRQCRPVREEGAVAARLACRLVLVAAALCADAATAQVQEYPTRTIRVVVPFSPGGAVDGPMRLIAQE